MLKSNKEGFRSLQRGEMKQVIGGAGGGVGCPTACVLLAPNDQILQGTCGTAANGSCYCTADNGFSEKGCSETPYWLPGGGDPIGEGGSL